MMIFIVMLYPKIELQSFSRSAEPVCWVMPVANLGNPPRTPGSFHQLGPEVRGAAGQAAGVRTCDY